MQRRDAKLLACLDVADNDDDNGGVHLYCHALRIISCTGLSSSPSLVISHQVSLCLPFYISGCFFCITTPTILTFFATYTYTVSS